MTELFPQIVRNPQTAAFQQMRTGVQNPGAGVVPGNQFQFNGANPFQPAFGGQGNPGASANLIARNINNDIRARQAQLSALSAQYANSGFDDPALQQEIEQRSNALSVGSKLLTGMTQLRKTLRDESLKRIQIATS